MSISRPLFTTLGVAAIGMSVFLPRTAASGGAVVSKFAFVGQFSPILQPRGLRSAASPALRRAGTAKRAAPAFPTLGLRPSLTVSGLRMTATADAEAELSSSASQGYPFTEIEKKWQAKWKEDKTFRTPHDVDMTKPKYYVLDMFPYPSGAGLHVGHPEGYTATDILSRFKRMNGFNVMHPMGWDAFGLPAEQYAIQTGTHPRITTEKNVNRFREQLQALGFSYDWDREVSTTDEKYYKWTQWIFLKLYEKGLAYQAEVPVNWCPALGTVLANEEVIDGKSERGDHPVYRKNLKQWMLKITAYADRLLDDLDELDWPDSVKEMQRNWIGRSEGAEVSFALDGAAPSAAPAAASQETEGGKVFVGSIPWRLTNVELEEAMSEFGPVKAANVVMDRETGRSKGYGFAEFERAEDAAKAMGAAAIEIGGRNCVIKEALRATRYNSPASSPAPAAASGEAPALKVFTTRPDTLFGATYMVVSPEHPLLDAITTPEQKEAVAAYVEAASRKSDLERTEVKDKTGLFTGGYAINPLTKKKVPIWVADYVLATYGTGAIMAVPAHDDRDHEFAKKFELPIVEVVSGGEDVQEAAYTGDGALVNSASDELDINGMAVAEAKAKTIAYLADKGLGDAKVNYKLRDWLFSRQRYWGEPFPISFKEDGSPVPATEAELPVALPDVESYQPSGTTEGPLSTISEWVNHEASDGTKLRRETNTMPQWAGSCWYYLRFLDPENPGAPIDKKIEDYWMPVDLYCGGAEHAVLHLLYARFWHKVLYDCGVVHTKEPFQRLVNQGLILGPVEHTAYKDGEGAYVSAKFVKDGAEGMVDKRTQTAVEAESVTEDQLVKKGDAFVLKSDKDIRVVSKAVKMSKSKGNVVNPDDVVDAVGADSLRLYLMFMGPLEQVKPWNTNGVDGVFRFLNRVWRLLVDNQAGVPLSEEPATKEQLKALHTCIRDVTFNTDRLGFNSAIADMMQFINVAYKWDSVPREAVLPFIQLLNPYAPHMAEELWERMGQSGSVVDSAWPELKEEYLVEDEVTVAVQVNGKVRATVQVPADADQESVMAIVEATPAIQKWTEGKEIKKRIYVPGKICNLVVVG